MLTAMQIKFLGVRWRPWLGDRAFNKALFNFLERLQLFLVPRGCLRLALVYSRGKTWNLTVVNHGIWFHGLWNPRTAGSINVHAPNLPPTPVTSWEPTLLMQRAWSCHGPVAIWWWRVGDSLLLGCPCGGHYPLYGMGRTVLGSSIACHQVSIYRTPWDLFFRWPRMWECLDWKPRARRSYSLRGRKGC